jgi:hypothetical protein
MNARTIAARDIRPGDMLDLFGDKYADPHSSPALGLEFENSVTESVAFEKGKRGSVDCCVIYGSGINFACPPDHQVAYAGRDPSWPLQTREEAVADIHSDGYRHTAGNSYAKLRRNGRGMDWAELRSNDEGDHWIVHIN